MRNSKRLIALLFTLIIFAAFALTVSAEAPVAESAQQKDMWWVIGIMIAVLNLEIVTIVSLGVIIGFKKRRGNSNKAMAFVFPFAFAALVPGATPLICGLLALGIAVSAGVIVNQAMTLAMMKKKPEPVVEPEPEPEPEIVEEAEIIETEEEVDEAAVAAALAAPIVVLDQIDYDDEDDLDIITADGVEIISVVWPERRRHNKLYRYSPNGVQFEPGEIVLVPTRDVMRNREILRKAAVVHGNHRVDPNSLQYELKKVVGKVKKTVE